MLDCDAAPTLRRTAQIMADACNLQVAHRTLMMNGIEAIKDTGGVVTVKSQFGEAAIEISVNDTGRGLPQARTTDI